MTSYHGWTHRRKSDGGTDPIYPDGDEPWSGGAAVPTPWAWRKNTTIATDVPGDGSWTDIVLSNGAIPPGQTAITLVTDGIHVEDAGIYLVTLEVRMPGGSGSTGWAQARLVFEHEGVPSGTTIVSQANGQRDAENALWCQMTRFLAYPGLASGFQEIKVACRQTTGAIRTPDVHLSIVQLTPLHDGSPEFPRL